MYYTYECETCTRTFGSTAARAQNMNALDHWAERFECDTYSEVFLDRDECDYHMDEYGHYR